MADEQTAPIWRFQGRYVDKDPSGYYYPRWDQATPVSVLATSKAEANEKLWALLGDAPRHRTWTVIWDRVDEEAPDAR